MSFLAIYLVNLLVILGMMTLLWVVSLKIKNSSIVDIFWGFGFVLSTWLVFILTPDGYLIRKLILSLLVTLWGVRLSIHIFIRNKGKPEDFRYQAWRKVSGNTWWWKSYFQVFVLQGFLMWVISIPLLAAQFDTGSNRLIVWDFIGMALWGIGFFFEAVGDVQLARFKANPANKGRVMNRGVWRFSRHPNYFGEVTQWWGIFFIALSIKSGYLTILGPLTITILILFVSGIPLLERKYAGRPDFEEYKK